MQTYIDDDSSADEVFSNFKSPSTDDYLIPLMPVHKGNEVLNMDE